MFLHILLLNGHFEICSRVCQAVTFAEFAEIILLLLPFHDKDTGENNFETIQYCLVLI